MGWHDLGERSQVGRWIPWVAFAMAVGCNASESRNAAIDSRSEPLNPVASGKILPSLSGATHEFGRAVAFDGTTVVVGAPSFDTIGRAFVFRVSGTELIEEGVLTPVAGGVRDFGAAVAVDGDAIVVGAPDFDGSSPGKALVFRRALGTWAQEAELDQGLSDKAMFGAAVDIDADRVLVGAPHTETNDDGMAFVFLRSGTQWNIEDVVHGDGSVFTSDGFGLGVAIEGDVLAVGAPLATFSSAGVGVYVFERAGAAWIEVQKIDPSTFSSDRRFGWDVALSGTTMLIGCPSVSNQEPYIDFYEHLPSGWELTATLDRPSTNSSFGRSVALHGDTAWVGSPLADTVGSDSGMASVYLRDANGWSLLDDFVTPDTAAQDMLGASVAVFGRTAVIGAPGDDDDGSSSGSAWLVLLEGDLGEPCSSDDACASGYCVDGVCCEDVCGGRLDDCLACSVTAGSTQDGQCGPISGTACEDDDPCTQAGMCSAGVCVGSDPVQCEALDACHEPGTCDDTNGSCSNPIVEDGKTCPGGTCLGGNCVLSDGGTAGGGGSAGGGGAAGAGQAGGAGSGGVSGSGGGAGTGGGSNDAGLSATAPEDVESSGFYACAQASNPVGRTTPWVVLGLLIGWMRTRRLTP